MDPEDRRYILDHLEDAIDILVAAKHGVGVSEQLVDGIETAMDHIYLAASSVRGVAVVQDRHPVAFPPCEVPPIRS